jgi:hypothetical protein
MIHEFTFHDEECAVFLSFSISANAKEEALDLAKFALESIRAGQEDGATAVMIDLPSPMGRAVVNFNVDCLTLEHIVHSYEPRARFAPKN